MDMTYLAIIPALAFVVLLWMVVRVFLSSRNEAEQEVPPDESPTIEQVMEERRREQELADQEDEATVIFQNNLHSLYEEAESAGVLIDDKE